MACHVALSAGTRHLKCLEPTKLPEPMCVPPVLAKVLRTYLPMTRLTSRWDLAPSNSDILGKTTTLLGRGQTAKIVGRHSSVRDAKRCRIWHRHCGTFARQYVGPETRPEVSGQQRAGLVAA